MDILSVSAILTYLSVKFPDAFEGFSKKGIIVAMPSPSNDVLIYHPDLPASIKKDLEEEAKNTVGEQAPHPLVIESLNYEFIDDDHINGVITDIKNTLNEIEPKVTLVSTLLALIISSTHIKSTGAKGKKLRKAILKFKGVSRAYVLWKDRCELIETKPDEVDIKEAIENLISSL